MTTDASESGSGSAAAAKTLPGGGPGALGAALQAARGWLGLWFGLLLCGTLFLGWCAIAFVIRPFLSVRLRRRIGRAAMHRMFQFYLAALQRFGIVEVDNAELLGLRHEG